MFQHVTGSNRSSVHTEFSLLETLTGLEPVKTEVAAPRLDALASGSWRRAEESNPCRVSDRTGFEPAPRPTPGSPAKFWRRGWDSNPRG